MICALTMWTCLRWVNTFSQAVTTTRLSATYTLRNSTPLVTTQKKLASRMQHVALWSARATMQTNKQRVKKLSSTELQHRAQPNVAKKLIQNKSGDLHRFFVPSYFRVTNPWVLLECPSNYAIPF